MPPAIPNLDAALAQVTAASDETALDSSKTPRMRADDLHVYALARGESGTLVLGHVSHSSHSSHSSGTTHYSHGSHSSHTSHASHVSGSTGPGPGPGSGPGSGTGTGSSASHAQHGKPDLRIGAHGGSLVGNNVYGPAKHQTVSGSGESGSQIVWRISLQNDAKVSDRIGVLGASSGDGFTVQYLNADGKDVTDAVTSGGFETLKLEHSATYVLQVVVTVTESASAERPLLGKVVGTSVRSPHTTDTVAFSAHRE